MSNSTKITKRYSDDELAEFEQLINQKISQAQEQLDYYMNQIRDLGANNDSKVKGLDDGTSTLESERIYTMASRQRKLIQHLENAKLRIKMNIVLYHGRILDLLTGNVFSPNLFRKLLP